MAQHQQEVQQMVQALEASKGKGGKHKKQGFSCKKSTFAAADSKIFVDSWKFNDWDYKRDDLPTYARGLFTTKKSDGNPEIVIRGYDKFFNVDEVRSTEWRNIECRTVGPYELSVKENGCIIFFSGLEDGTLLVCSKHSTGARGDVEKSHAMVGEAWIKRHVESVGKSTADLAKTLRGMNVTAVGELCDDEFEEHVLAYPPSQAGLYLHGLNTNLPEFATASGREVHEFANAWGFKKAEYHIIQDLSEVKDFLAKCAETGSWSGRDTEGFVIRCKIKDAKGNGGNHWFFKYKFEEPYLMYRQWREATKAVIANKAPRFKKHKKITEEYLLFARRRLATDKNLAKQYNMNHGIIEMRDAFLAEKGKRGADLIAEEAAARQNGDLLTNILLVPIATIGCGKTTVAAALVKLFGWGHVQNDNIQGKGNRPQRFTTQITNTMTLHNVVIADRNNHQKREREQLISDVANIIPDTKFVALHYVHEPKNTMLNGIRKVTQGRVLDRGDNHQTIHAGSKGQAEIVGIMEGFLNRFQACDINHAPDSNFDEVIDLDVMASSEENLETVINHLYNAYPGLFKGDMPSHQDMENAITFAMDNTVDPAMMHDLGSKSQNTRNQKMNGPKQKTPDPKQQTHDELVKRLEYFGISLSTPNINSILSTLFSDGDAEEARFYEQLKGAKRIQNSFHVTLMHRASNENKPQLWQLYTELYKEVLSKQENTADRTPSLGAARLRLERVIWDDRVIGILVRILPSSNGTIWDCANQYPHITIGTANDGIKPFETNALIQQWMDTDGKDGTIRSKEIPGMKELDGAVKPVLQRGR